MKKALIFIIALHLLVAQVLYAKSKEVIIQKVIDGETVELSDGRRVHLIGIKTSEVQPILTNRFKLSMDKIAELDLAQLAQGAAAYIENHAVGKNVFLSFDPAYEKRDNKDPEGRTLAYLWYVSHVQSGADSEGNEKLFGVKSENRLLNQELLMMGHALVDTSSGFLQMEDFLNTEKSAARGTVGFWRSAADIYGDLLSQAHGAQLVSTAGFVSKDSQKTSLEASRKAFTELIQLNPQNFSPYYERSWLGANPIHDKIENGNLIDAQKSVELSVFNPKCYMQKSYLHLLMGQYDDSSQSYTQMTHAAGKMGMASLVTEMSLNKIQQAPWKDIASEPGAEPLVLDALRASLNEDHFLVFMARYKDSQVNTSEIVGKVYNLIASQGRFPIFLKKHESFLASASPREIIYRTQWAIRGHEMPEDVMRWMEMIGEVNIISSSNDKDVIDMTGRDEQPKKKNKNKSEASQSDTQFI